MMYGVAIENVTEFQTKVSSRWASIYCFLWILPGPVQMHYTCKWNRWHRVCTCSLALNNKLLPTACIPSRSIQVVHTCMHYYTSYIVHCTCRVIGIFKHMQYIHVLSHMTCRVVCALHVYRALHNISHGAIFFILNLSGPLFCTVSCHSTDLPIQHTLCQFQLLSL